MKALDEITLIRAPIGRCFDLARSVEVHLEGNIHWGESAIATGGVTTGLVGLGQRVTWQARHFGIRWRLTSEITVMEEPGFFQDTMIDGPFGSMQHDHYFEAVASGETQMRDVFRFSAPLGILGQIAEPLFLTRHMRALLLERNAVIRRIAESEEWRKYVAGA